MAQQESDFLNDPRFHSLLVECLERLERGETLEGEILKKKYPEWSGHIHEFLNDQEQLKRIARTFRDAEGLRPERVSSHLATDPTIDSKPRADQFGAGHRIRYIGEYEILQEIARGGMGIVFKARQQRLSRIVALKMILTGRLADQAEVLRFHREARAAASLQHPNIVAIHEIGEHDGHHYFTMDFVDGPSLSEVLREGTLSPRTAAKLVMTVAEAVHAAHERGTLHRDLKPANILLASTADQGSSRELDKRAAAQSTPKITDFGLAKMLDEVNVDSQAELTASGQILGTPCYMSPEQAKGKRSHIGPATDIYSLGAILYACLTGRAPFIADSPIDTLMQVIRSEPATPRLLNAKIPKDLETVCLKCLNKEPQRRYGTAQQLADDLERFLEGRPVLARPIGSVAKAWRWCRRNTAVAALLLIAIVSLSGGAVVATAFAVAAHNRALEAREAAVAEQNQRAIAEQRQQESQRHLYVAHMNLVSSAVATGNLESARRLLAQHLPQPKAEDLRAFEWYHWRNLCDSVQPITSHAALAQWMAVSPDGKKVACALLVPGSSRVDLWDLPTGETKQIDVQAGLLAFSNDGQRLAIADLTQPRLTVWDMATESKLCELTTVENPVSVAFSPDDRFVVTGIQNSIVFFDSTSGDQVRVLDDLAAPITAFAFAPRGDRLIVGCSDGSVCQLAINGQDHTKPVKAHQDAIVQVNIIPHSDTYATLSRDGTVQIRDIEADQHRSTLKVAFPTRIAVSPDGQNLLVSDWDGGVVQGIDIKTGQEFVRWKADQSVYDVAFLSGTQVVTIGESISTWRIDRRDIRRILPPVKTYSVTAGNLLLKLAISPDGESVVGSDKGVRSLKSQARIRLDSHDAENQVAYSPQGDRIATGSNRHKLTMWDASNGQRLWSRELHQSNVSSVAFSPNGNLLASGSLDRQALIVDATTGDLLHALGGHEGVVSCVAFSPDGHKLASAGRDIRLWSVETGQQIPTAADIDDFVQHITFTPDGKRLVGCGNKTIFVWDAVTFGIVKTLTGHAANVLWVDVSPDGSTIASASNDRTVKLWDFRSGQEKASFAFRSDVSCVQFSADGQILAAADGRNVTVLHAPRDPFSLQSIAYFFRTKTFDTVDE